MNRSMRLSRHATRCSARRTASRRSRTSSVASVRNSPRCSVFPTGGRSCSATAVRPCFGTSRHSGSFANEANTWCSASSPTSLRKHVPTLLIWVSRRSSPPILARTPTQSRKMASMSTRSLTTKRRRVWRWTSSGPLGRPRTMGSSSSTPRQRLAGSSGNRTKSTSTTSPHRSVSRPTAVCGSRRVRRQRPTGSRRSAHRIGGGPHRSTSRSHWTIRGSTRRTTRRRLPHS